MSPTNEPIHLDTKRVSGGNLEATYSLRPAVRIRVQLLPGAYAAGDLAIVRDRVKRWFTAPPTTTETPAEDAS